MGVAAIISLSALLISTLIALLTVTFKSGVVLSELRELQKKFEAAKTTIEEQREQVAKIPSLERDVQTVQGTFSHFTTQLATLHTRAELNDQRANFLAERMGSIKEMRRVAPSLPQLPTETDGVRK